jgi:hypothetical protein
MHVIERNKNELKREKLREYGELVYDGGGDELVKLVDDVLAGRMLVL